jgi:hypothetical protein
MTATHPGSSNKTNKPREMTLRSSRRGRDDPGTTSGRPANGGARQLQRGARSTVSCPGHPADGGHETNRLPRPHFLGCAAHGSE